MFTCISIRVVENCCLDLLAEVELFACLKSKHDYSPGSSPASPSVLRILAIDLLCAT